MFITPPSLPPARQPPGITGLYAGLLYRYRVDLSMMRRPKAVAVEGADYGDILLEEQEEEEEEEEDAKQTTFREMAGASLASVFTGLSTEKGRTSSGVLAVYPAAPQLGEGDAQQQAFEKEAKGSEELVSFDDDEAAVAQAKAPQLEVTPTEVLALWSRGSLGGADSGRDGKGANASLLCQLPPRARRATRARQARRREPRNRRR